MDFISVVVVCLFPFLFFFCRFAILSFSMRRCFELHGVKQIPQHSSIELWILSLEACFKMLCAPDLVSFITSSHQETGCSQGSHTVQHSLTCLLPPCNVCGGFFLFFFLITGFGSILVTSQCCDTEQWPKKFPPCQRL